MYNEGSMVRVKNIFKKDLMIGKVICNEYNLDTDPFGWKEVSVTYIRLENEKIIKINDLDLFKIYKIIDVI